MSKIDLVTKREKQKEKESVIKDENGYYRVTFGRFNDYNANGIFYRVTDLEEVLGENSLFGKRLLNGYARSEWSHPDVSRLSPEELKRRTVTLDIDRICNHIKRLEVIPTGKESRDFNLPIYDIYGWVKPEGPYGDYLREQLDNPDSNTAYSIRSLVRQTKVGSIVVRDIVIISTWDVVYMPGIATANQWNAAGIEHQDIIIEDNSEIVELRKGFESMDTQCEDGKCILKALDTALTKLENPIFKL